MNTQRDGIRVSIGLITVLSAFTLMQSGCVVRTYQVTKERTDQDLGAGNRGLMQGKALDGSLKERKLTRTLQAIEIEMHPLIKFKKSTRQKKMPQSEAEAGKEALDSGLSLQADTQEAATQMRLQPYTVAKGDTLQKISQKFFGTSKKWMGIYEANKDVLKSPDKVFPGQEIQIPMEQIPVQPERLK